MSARKQELTSQDISYTWTNSSKTEFVLHCDGTGIVRGFVGPGRKSFSIEVDGQGTLAFRRMVDAKKMAATLWSKGHRVPFAGGRSVVISRPAFRARDEAQAQESLTEMRREVPPDTFAAEAFPYLHKDGEYAKRLSQPTDLVRNIKQVKRDELRDEYLKLIEYAPHRADRGKCYLVDGHTGIPSGTSDSNRFEDHLAMALWKLKRFWPRADGGQFYLLDYQFPLQARQSDRGIGKVDLVGLTKKRRFMVIELKVKPKGENNRGKTPVAALLQGLRYAAIVQANQEVIAKEVESRFKITVAEQPPIVQVLAPEDWWEGWIQFAGSTPTATGFGELAKDIEEQIGVTIECAALKVERQQLSFGGDDQPPRLARIPELRYLRLGAS